MFIHPSQFAVAYFIIKLVYAWEKCRNNIIFALYIYVGKLRNLEICVTFRKTNSTNKWSYEILH